MTEERQLTEAEEEHDIQEIVSEVMELPMFILAMIMLILLVVEFAVNLSPGWRQTVQLATAAIWGIFILEYILQVFLAHNRLQYLKAHWLDALFIFVPFLRVFRVLRVARSVRILRAVSPATLGRTYVTTRRGLRQLADVLGKRSLPYVLATTVIVQLVGSLLLLLIERNAPGTMVRSYGSAMWMVAGLLTTVGTELYPVTTEGRIVTFILMTYGMGIFGYIAATLASYFIQVDTNPNDPPEDKKYADLEAKIEKLLEELDKRK